MVLGLWCEIGSFGFVLIEQPGFICALSNVLPLVISPPSFSTIQVHYKHDLKIRMILWLIWKQVEGFLYQKSATEIWMYVQREVLQSSIGVRPPWRNLVNTCHHKFFLLLFSVHKSMWPIFFSFKWLLMYHFTNILMLSVCNISFLLMLGPHHCRATCFLHHQTGVLQGTSWWTFTG